MIKPKEIKASLDAMTDPEFLAACAKAGFNFCCQRNPQYNFDQPPTDDCPNCRELWEARKPT